MSFEVDSPAKKEKVAIVALADESGSMAGNEESVVTGYNEFIEKIQGEEDAKSKEVVVSLLFFDRAGGEEIIRVIYDSVPLATVKPLTISEYRPRGMTPLNDAMLLTIETTAKAEPDRALVMVMTDGLENASEADKDTVKRAVEKREAEGWRFVYMGANQDSWAESSARGMTPNSTYAFASTATGTRAAAGQMATSSASYLSSTAAYDRESREQYKRTGNVIKDPGETDLKDAQSAIARKHDEEVESAVKSAKEVI